MRLNRSIVSLGLTVSLLFAFGYAQDVYGVSATPSVIKLSAKAGESKNGSIDIHNGQDKEVFVKVAFKDWIVDEKGQRRFAEPGKNPRSLVDWIIIDSEGFALGPVKTQKVRYTIKVPEDAKGGYWGLVRFKSQPLGPATGVMVAMEIIAFIAVDVEETLEKKLVINEILAANDKEKGLSLKTKLKNMGNTPLFQPSPQGQIKINDAHGKKVAEGELTGAMILPDEIAEYTSKTPLTLDKEDYEAVITFDYGMPKLIGKKVSLTTKTHYDWRTLWERSAAVSQEK